MYAEEQLLRPIYVTRGPPMARQLLVSMLNYVFNDGPTPSILESWAYSKHWVSR